MSFSGVMSRRFALGSLMLSCGLLFAACGALGFGDALPSVLGVGSGGDPLQQQSEACTGALKDAVSSQGLADSESVNELISLIQSQNEGCGVPIWNPLATGDAGADECLRGIVQDQVAAGAVGAGESGMIFISMQGEGAAGESCFMYHARRGTWVESGLDHARRYMQQNRCRRAPGSMVAALDPDCVAQHGYPDAATESSPTLPESPSSVSD